MDWWFNTDMAKGRKPQDHHSPSLETKNTPPDEGEMRRIASEVFREANQNAAVANGGKKNRWINHSWVVATGSGLASALLVAAIFGIAGHFSSDSKRDVTDEIKRQLDQRRPEEATNLNNRISAEVARQLIPINSSLQALSIDIGKIKDHLNIAAIKKPRPLQSLEAYRSLDDKQFAASLPDLNTLLRDAASNKTLEASKKSLGEIAAKLSRTDVNTPDYWQTVLQFISFASSTALSNVPPPRPPNFTIAHNSGFGLIHTKQPITHQVILLDGGDLGPITFKDCRIIFTNDKVRMRGVRFINCVFEVPSTVQSNPSPYVQQATRQLLASNLTSIDYVS